jgi:hypothetical protein
VIYTITAVTSRDASLIAISCLVPWIEEEVVLRARGQRRHE